MFKGLGNLASLMKNASQMNERMRTAGEELKQRRVTGSAGGGMVEVEANGLGEVLKVKLDPDLFQRGERELLEDLIPAAVNQAALRARELHLELMRDSMGGLDLPGLGDLLGGAGGKS
ncbi:MAG: YbaB/EbfC family nucleoid-associated protein [Pirellulales bacterium]